MRDDVLQENIIQRQAGLNPEPNDRRLFDGRQDGASPLLGPIRSSSIIERERHFLTVFSLIP